MTTPIPPYLKSTDPEVLRHMDSEQRRWEEFCDRVEAFYTAHGATTCRLSKFLGSVRVSALVWDDPSGKPKRWTQDGRPFKNHPARQEFDDLRWPSKAWPGLPGVIGQDACDGNWSIEMVKPAVVVHAGTAYAHLGAIDPDRVSRKIEIGPQWTECLASEFYAAREAQRTEGAS